MVETVIVLIVFTPIGMCIGIYEFFNRGHTPCINMNNVDNINRDAVAAEG
jgi:hypothetical protein